MACTINDIRYTIRRDGENLPKLFPRLLRDRSMLPKIAYAIDYFESMVGRERQDMDGELFANFFGDYKLARCMVAALATTYQFRARRIDEVVSKLSAGRLARQGITAPKLLRLAFFDDVNARRSGFTVLNERDAAAGELAARLKVRPADVDRLLYLDLDEHAVLCRHGTRANAEDVAAQFNLAVLETLLRQAEQLELHLTDLPAEGKATADRICAGHGVAMEQHELHSLRLLGRQDALGSWSRHGRRLVRAALEILERRQGLACEGEATLALPNRRVRLRLTTDLIAMLTAPEREPADWQDDLAARDQIVQRVITEVHRQPRTWTIRRLPEALACRGGVILPDLRLHSAGSQVLIVAVRSAKHGCRLAHLASAFAARPYLFVGNADEMTTLRATGATCLAAATFDVAGLEAAPGVREPARVPAVAG